MMNKRTPTKTASDIGWKKYEEKVYQECKRVYNSHGDRVIRNTHLLGRYSGVKRQIDVLIRQSQDGKLVNTCIIECKHYSQKVNVKIVDSFIGCLNDVGANQGILISEKGFTKAAINRAHKGLENIEVDILNLGELKQFQGYGAIAYAGKKAIAIAPPFGWILDGKYRIEALTLFYRRGVSFEEATGEEREWMYLQLREKDEEIDTIEKLIKYQNASLKDSDNFAEIRLTEIDGLIMREAYMHSYPTPEITIFREFDDFIAFLVLYCPELYKQRDTNKAVSMLNKAIPLNVNIA